MDSEKLLPSVVKSGYEFCFTVDNMKIRAGGSSITGREYVEVDGQQACLQRSMSTQTSHTFERNGNQYLIEFHVIDKLKGPLVCRCYRNDVLTKVFAATPVREKLSGPVTAICVILLLLIRDDIVTSISATSVWIVLACTLGFAIAYPLTHIRISELKVSD